MYVVVSFNSQHAILCLTCKRLGNFSASTSHLFLGVLKLLMDTITSGFLFGFLGWNSGCLTFTKTAFTS